MKTPLTHIGLLLAGLLSLAAAGCSLRIPDTDTTEVALTFDPVMYAPVKATSGEYPADRDFTASVWNYGNPSTASPYLDAVRVTRSGNVWTPEPAALWPESDRRIVTLAASPLGAASSLRLDTGVVFTDIDTADQTDLLYTDPVTTVSRDATDGVVSLPFRHALSLMDFEMRSNASESQVVHVLGISLDRLHTRGSFASQPEPSWTSGGEADEVTFFTGKQAVTHKNEAVGQGRWVIPQPLATQVTVRIRVQEGEEVTTETLQSSPFRLQLEPGRHYTLTLACLLDAMTLKIDILDDIL